MPTAGILPVPVIEPASEASAKRGEEGLTARGDTPARGDITVGLDPDPVSQVIVQPDNANDNLSYDKFVMYQLAGDLYEHPERDQLGVVHLVRMEKYR